MRALVVKGILIALLLAVVTAASAATAFVNPPPFDPQRTLVWNFSQSDWETPYTAAGADWNTGEWTGDSFTHSSNLQWFDTSMWSGRQGMIGVDNTNGLQPVDGWLRIHLMNSTVNNPLKRIFLEVEFTQWGDVSMEDSFVTPTSVTASRLSDFQTELAGGIRSNEEWAVRPNPSWEEFYLPFTVQPGSGFYVDRFALSTACVPEPSALMALGTGLTGLAGFALRRRRS